jgi:hypothetical protein
LYVYRMGMAEVDVGGSPELEQGTIDFDQILADLAQNMRLYDELQVKTRDLEDAKNAALAPLEDIDIDTPVEMLPQGLAPAALHAFIIGRQIKALRAEMPAYDYGFKARRLLYRDNGLADRRVAVTSNDPDRYFLGTSTQDGQGLSRWHGSKKGKIKNLNLDHTQGGWLSIKGRMGLIYSTGSLIDRERDYQPKFSIQYLD